MQGRGASTGKPADALSYLFPGKRRVGVGFELCEAPVQFLSEFRGDRKWLLRRILGDTVPEVFDQLKPLRDRQLAEFVDGFAGVGHGADSAPGHVLRQVAAISPL